MEYVEISVTVELWQRVDGCVDNTMAIDVVEMNMESVINGSCVRDAGWRAAAAFTGVLDGWGWPPHDHPLPIVLRREHWEWVLLQLDRWSPYEDDDSLTCARVLIGNALDRRTS